MTTYFKIAAAIALACCPAAVAAEDLTINDIIALTEMQLGDAAIIAKIEAEAASFDLTTDQMIELKKKGVSSNVIAAMVRSGKADIAAELSVDSSDPNVPHPPGVYLLHGTVEKGRMERIEPTSSSQVKTGGIWGYALTGGIASASVKVSIPNAAARVVSTSKPYFYFFFDESQKGATASSFMGSAFLASSPADFNLVRLDKKKDRREARVGSMNIGGAKMGVMDKDRITIEYELVRPGVYKVKAGDPLAPGEYGFLYSLPGAAAGGAANARIFDFSVK